MLLVIRRMDQDNRPCRRSCERGRAWRFLDEMQAPSMNKSTQAISLVLMGSALALAGCSSGSDDDEDDRAARSGHGYAGGARLIAGPRVGTGRGGIVGAGASARGGFGGIGGISAGS
jgi:hypothetical protein